METCEFGITRNDGHIIHNYLWTPEKTNGAHGIFLIVHGAAEHAKRYQGFAEFLTANGYIACACEHRGHGLSVQSSDDLGFFSDANGWQKIIEDLNAVLLYLKNKYTGLKVFMLGHSMGSYLARTYSICHGDEIDALILSGTSHNPKPLLVFGKLMAELDIAAGKARKLNPILNKLTFKDLNKSFKEGKTGFEWLSADPDIVDKYAKDELCGFDFTSAAFRDMFEGLLFITDNRNIRKMPKNLPILLIAGDNDPIGGCGRMVEKCYRAFLNSGLSNVKLKLYNGMRHEILNEIGKEIVYQDILEWSTKNLRLIINGLQKNA